MQSLHAVLDEPVGPIMKKFWNAWVIELEIGGKSYRFSGRKVAILISQRPLTVLSVRRLL